MSRTSKKLKIIIKLNSRNKWNEQCTGCSKAFLQIDNWIIKMMHICGGQWRTDGVKEEIDYEIAPTYFNNISEITYVQKHVHMCVLNLYFMIPER